MSYQGNDLSGIMLAHWLCGKSSLNNVFPQGGQVNKVMLHYMQIPFASRKSENATSSILLQEES